MNYAMMRGNAGQTKEDDNQTSAWSKKATHSIIVMEIRPRERIAAKMEHDVLQKYELKKLSDTPKKAFFILPL